MHKVDAFILGGSVMTRDAERWVLRNGAVAVDKDRKVLWRRQTSRDRERVVTGGW